MKLRIGLMSLFSICFLSSASNAQTSLFKPENINGWIDFRASSTNAEKSWLDGGFGKLRNGAGSETLELAELALVWEPRFSDSLTAYLQLEHNTAAGGSTGVNEAYLKFRPVPKSPLRVSAKLGQYYPPVSLEHDGMGWATPRTITPSAINSWIGEEILVKGAEFSVQNKFAENTIALTLGAFKSNDTAGTLLIFRGWALNDMRTSSAQKLPLTSGAAGFKNVFGAQAHYTMPLVEVDGKTGFYGRIDWKPPMPVTFNATYYATNGNPEIVIRGQYGWDTKFQNYGMTYSVSENTEILSQYLKGSAAMGPNSGNGYRVAEVSYNSFYILASHTLANETRLSARADLFSVDDKAIENLDNNNEDGTSLTLALAKPLNKNTDLKLELINIQSDRPARELQFTRAKQNQTSLQLGLRFHF